MSWRASCIIWMCAIVFIAIGWFLGDADSRTVVDSGPQRVLEPEVFSIDDVDAINAGTA